MSAVSQRVSFQASAEAQDLRIVVRAPRPLHAMVSNQLWLDVGGIGGAEFAPWETFHTATAWPSRPGTAASRTRAGSRG